ncbi:MAG: sensor histidine kinase [Solirubrobacterales bacterium]|nr:sensor histidine kinase [Solirubrobacterales bacterium]
MSRFADPRRRRLVLAAVTLVAVAVVVALAVALRDAQSDARRTVEERFTYGPRTASALVGTIISQAYNGDAQLAQGALAGKRLTQADVDRAQVQQPENTIVVLDAGGRVLASSPAGRRPAVAGAPHIRQALAGRPAISGALGRGRTGTIEVAVPFQAADGRRVFVASSPLPRVQAVLAPYLADLPGLEGHRGYIVDSAGRVLAADRPGTSDAALQRALAAASSTAEGNVGDRRFARAAVPATGWGVVDTVERSVLYAPVEGWERSMPWIVLLLLLPAGAVIVLLADRAGRAAESARRASEAKSAFLASMSHELRTPMTTVIGFSEMLAQGRLGELSERQREVVGHIHSSSQHLNKLIGEVLDLSRVEEGRLAFHPEDVEPHLLVAEVAEGMGGIAADRGVAIELDAPDVGTFRLDSARFKQVLYNLIGNALKFTEPGGRVTVRLWQEEHGELGVEVSDTGAGIPADQLERIFLPFEQGTRRNGGAGLGLAVSRRIVDAQGGRIGVESALGEGSRFTVRLPAARR